MKPISILKKLITALYYILGLGFLINIFKVIKSFFSPKMVNPTLLKGEELYSSNSIKVIIVQIIAILLLFAFFKAINFLKNSLNDLSAGNHFSNKVIRNFKSAGILLVICGLGELLGKIIAGFLFENRFNINFDSSIILFPVIGLFFLYLHEVFSEARAIQNEHNLTV